MILDDEEGTKMMRTNTTNMRMMRTTRMAIEELSPAVEKAMTIAGVVLAIIIVLIVASSGI